MVKSSEPEAEGCKLNSHVLLACYQFLSYQAGHFFPVGQTGFVEVIEIEEASKALEVLCSHILRFQESLKGQIPILHFHCFLM